MDDAATGATGEVAGKEVVLVFVVQADAWVVGHAGGAVAEVGQRGQHIRHAVVVLQVPDLLGVPRATVRLWHRRGVHQRAVLVAAAPAAVATFHNLNPAGLVATVAVVVVGEQVAVVVEGHFLRVAQSTVDDLHVLAVPVAAEHSAFIRQVNVFLVDGGDVGSAVADAEVQLAVRPHGEAVHVVPEELRPQAEAGGEAFLDFGHAVAVLVLQAVQVGNAGGVHAALAGQHPGHQAVLQLVVPLAEHRALVGLAAAGAVPHHADLVVVAFVAVVLRTVLVLLVHLQAVVHRPRADVLVQPVHVATGIGHALVEAGGFAHIGPTLFVEREGHGVHHQRLGSPQLGLHTGRHADGGAGLVGVDIRCALGGVGIGWHGKGEGQTKPGHRHHGQQLASPAKHVHSSGRE